MANQPETASYSAGIYQIETNDPVQGGVGGLDNVPLLQLANRTAYLKLHLDSLEQGTTIPPGIAPLASPNFSGSPTVPTAPSGDNSTLASNTAFVQNAVNGISTINVAGGVNVTLSAAQAGVGILRLTGALTANIAVIVPAASHKWQVQNQTGGAFALTVKTASGSGVAVTQGMQTELWCDGTNVLLAQTDFVSPAFSGSPTAPTPAAGDSSQLLATTAFVAAQADASAIIYAIVFGG
jgi:hypothetical protein